MELQTVGCFECIFSLIASFLGGGPAGFLKVCSGIRRRLTASRAHVFLRNRQGVRSVWIPWYAYDLTERKTVLFQKVHPLGRLNLIPCLVRV